MVSDPNTGSSDRVLQAPGHYRFARGAATYRVAADVGILSALGDAALVLQPGTYSTSRGGRVLLAADGAFEFTPASLTFWGDDEFVYAADLTQIHVRLTVQPLSDLRLTDLVRGAGNGLVVEGNENFARSIAAAGDVNGDGLEDLIVGESGILPDAASSCLAETVHGPGAAYVVFGRTDTNPILLANENGTGRAFSINGPGGDADAAGHSVAGAGDVNGDGLDDVLVGAPFAGDGTFGVGAAYLAFGKVDSSPVETAVLPFGSCASDSGISGMRIGPPDAATSLQLGRAVAGGDLNGDGLADLILGAPCFRDNAFLLGEAHVIYGQQRGCFPSAIDLDEEAPNFRLTGGSSGDYLGSSLHDIGDFNGDGLDDLIVTGTGAYIVFGAREKPPWRPFGVPLYDSHALVAQITDERPDSSQTGFRVAAAKDVNGDGFDDVLVSTREYDRLEYFVVFGRPGTGAISLGDGGGGFELGDGSDDMVAAGVGDVDGDGLDDIALASDLTEPVHETIVVLGSSGAGYDGLWNVRSNSGFGFRIVNVSSDTAGYALAGGDFNGDGLDDVMLAAPHDASVGSGSAYVVFGWDATNALGDRVSVDLRGPADDTIDYPALPIVRLSGGHGFDTLRVPGHDLRLDLRGQFTRIRSIEAIDITGDGTNTLIVDDAVLRRLPERRPGLPGYLVKVLKVVGGPDDTVEMDASQYDVVANSDGVVYQRIGQHFGLELAGPTLAPLSPDAAAPK